MAFWGLKVEPNTWTPFVPPPEEQLRLHISQACLAGDKVPKDKTRVVVKCRAEAEDDEERQEFNICTIIGGVVESCALDLIFGGYAEFYAEGAHPVHLTGYFMPEFGDEDDDEREAYMRQMEEDEDDDSEEEEEEDSEEDDDSEDEDDFGVLEAFDEDDDDSEEEDDDSEEEESDDPAPRKTKKGGVVIEELDDDEKEKTPEEAPKKEKAAAKETKKRPAADAPEAPAPAPKKEKKKDPPDENQPKKEPKKEPPKKEAAAEPAPAPAAKGQRAREFKNGMEIVTVAQGPPGGKQAKPGKRVTMRYVGRLQSGKIFDQTKGNATFAFRLGVGEVIRGWDVGVDGMRVGDKRRLTIPHTLAYGKKGVRGAIPGGATLIFDVELVSVA